MNSIRDVLAELNVDFREAGQHGQVSHGWIGVCCPFCGETNFHLGINLAHGNASCWKCGPHQLAESLKEITGESWGRIRGLLGEVETSYERKEEVRGRLVYPKGVTEMLPVHRAYLRRRGFDPDEVHRLWNVHGIGLAAKLAWRLFLPINFRGKTVSWTTRSLSDEADARYISAIPKDEAVPAKSLLYGWDYVRHAAIIVEGPIDAWRIGPGAVATLGTSYSKAQVLLMASLPVRVVCFDSVSEAQRRADKLCSELAAHPGRTVRVEIDAADPGSASKREVAKLRKEFLE